MEQRVRYLFHDLLTNRFIEELPLVNVDLQRQMATVGPGNFSADLNLGDERVRLHKNWRDATDARGSVVYTELNGNVLSCHVVWDTSDNLKSKVRRITGAELWSYIHHRCVTYDRVYTRWDQLDIVRDLLLQEFREVNANIGLRVSPVGSSSSGRIRASVIYQGEAGKDLAQACEEQANLIDGFDFDIVCWRDPLGGIQRRFVMGFPRLGVDNSPLVFSWPGNILDSLVWPRVGSAAVNRAIALGQSRLRQDWPDDDSLRHGYALMEAVTNYHDVNDAGTLLAHAQSDLASQRWPPYGIQQRPSVRPSQPTSWRRSTRPASVPSIPLRSDQVDVAQLASSIGDSISLLIEDPVFFPSADESPDGLDHRVLDRYRLVGIQFKPDTKEVSLMLNSLDGLDARLRAIGQ